MIETISALLLAHALADFPLQTSKIATRKSERAAGALALHAGAVLITAHLALGHWWSPWLLALVAVHLAIDLAKSFLPEARLWPFLIDQTAHLLSILAIGILAPDLWSQGAWAGAIWAPPLMAVVAGAILATQAGGYAVGLLLTPFEEPEGASGLKDAGRLIGLLERGLIFVLVMVGQPAGIGFLIAAKSILRFETTTSAKNQKAASEYIIIGTLASFGWAMAVSWATLALLGALAPIGIPALSD